MMACAGLCACTNEEVVGTGGTTAEDELGGAVAYITVNIKDVGSSTRADDGGFANGNSTGNTNEQNVSNAYFYFYDEDGNYMARGSVASVSGEATGDAGTNNGSIEWESNTVVAVWGLTDYDNLPTKMVTVLNQPDNFFGANLSLSEMGKALSTASEIYKNATKTYGLNIVMTTSSYMDDTNIVNYTALSADDFSLEPINFDTDYPSGVVDVYVERLAAKVDVALSSSMGDGNGGSLTTSNNYYDITKLVGGSFVDATFDDDNPLYLSILGWDINGTARDSYMLKNITSWDLSFDWNDYYNHRSYWAESPNYGIGGYPTSSNGNTDTDEANASTWLNNYLKYTSLNSPIAFGTSGYCAENTNTADVLSDASSTGITNVLVKAQAVDANGDGLDLVQYRGEYYTPRGFLDKCVADVVDYDFTFLVDEVIDALKEEYPDYSSYIDELNAAIYHDYVFYTPANNTDANPSYFDGSMLSLYNAYDGNVKIYFNMTTQPKWSDGTNIDPTLAAKYPASDIVYGGTDLDDYVFYFHIDSNELGFLERIGLTALGVITQKPYGSGDYYMELSNDIVFSTAQGHSYTARNYFLRAITEEADDINTLFGSIQPIFYNQGLMYYAIPIEHLASASSDALVEGQYGVVRNHWYNINIDYISNLGRGIAVENEVIVPQPELDYYYLGATVNILSWKVVNQSAGLK